MKTFYACLIAGATLGLPTFASAQTADSKYCSALTEKYVGFLATNNQQRPQDPQDVSARAGIRQCMAGNTAVGIPLLESGLRNAGIDLPPREASPTFMRVTHGHSKGG